VSSLFIDAYTYVFGSEVAVVLLNIKPRAIHELLYALASACLHKISYTFVPTLWYKYFIITIH
jgi:hypothetical protein